jgi:hypothetical protein
MPDLSRKKSDSGTCTADNDVKGFACSHSFSIAIFYRIEETNGASAIPEPYLAVERSVK